MICEQPLHAPGSVSAGAIRCCCALSLRSAESPAISLPAPARGAGRARSAIGLLAGSVN